MNVLPKQQTPDFQVPLVSSSTFDLTDAMPESFTMIVVYRGYHCPVCKSYTGELNANLDTFAKQGATSSPSKWTTGVA